MEYEHFDIDDKNGVLLKYMPPDDGAWPSIDVI